MQTVVQINLYRITTIFQEIRRPFNNILKSDFTSNLLLFCQIPCLLRNKCEFYCREVFTKYYGTPVLTNTAKSCLYRDAVFFLYAKMSSAMDYFRGS